MVKEMREYILTSHERSAAETFFADKKGSNQIRVMRHRAQKALQRLKEDVAILERLVESQ